MVERMEHALWCDGCGVEMTSAPILVEGRRFCCPLYATGGDYECGYVVEDEEEGPAIIES